MDYRNKLSTFNDPDYNGRRSVFDILSLSGKEEKNIIEKYDVTEKINTVTINNNKFTNYGNFQFIWEKSYVKNPERSGRGSIENLNSYTSFVTPHLILNFSVMSIDDYRQIIRMDLEQNEFVVECYDPIYNEMAKVKMYFATPEMAKLYTIQRYRENEGEWEDWLELVGVQDYTVELIGTNANIETVDVIYYLNNPAPDNYFPDTAFSYYAEPSVYAGEDIIIGGAATDIVNETFNGELRFNGWNISSDKPMEQKTQGNYVNGNVAVVPSNGLKLYAQWSSQAQHKLLFNYGLADPVINNESLSYETFRNVTYETSIGTLPTPADPKVKAKDLDGKEKEYPVYYDGGWYKTPIKASDYEVVNYDLFWARRDTTIYRLYDVYKYYIDYNIPNATNDGYIYHDSNWVPYNSSVTLATLYKTENGKDYIIDTWYTDKDCTKVFSSGNMPPYDVDLYGKWVEK